MMRRRAVAVCGHPCNGCRVAWAEGMVSCTQSCRQIAAFRRRKLREKGRDDMRAFISPVAPDKYELTGFRPGSAPRLPTVPIIHAIGKALAAALRRMRTAAQALRRIGGGR
jgi:hypothetical protein